jgi:hypothetical protein
MRLGLPNLVGTWAGAAVEGANAQFAKYRKSVESKLDCLSSSIPVMGGHDILSEVWSLLA